MKRFFQFTAVALFIVAGACSRSRSQPADTTLNTDLSLAAQQRNYAALDSAEHAGEVKAAAQTSGVRRASSGAVSHTAARHSGTVTEKHTQRDAVIGAAAGAVIGATTSRNKVKGGVIGAAVGGILGGVIGNNVDKTKKKP